MIAVILCTGFATRMYPLTKTSPKPLLPVANRPVLDYLMDQIVDLPGVQTIHIVSNARFYNHYRLWYNGWEERGEHSEIAVQIHNDKATDNQNRLGAAVDLQFVLNSIEHPGRMLVTAGDNIYRFEIQPLWEKFLQSDHHHVVALPESDRKKLHRTGVLELGENDRLLRLHEKVELPPSTWICPPLYFFQPSVESKLESFLQTSENHDAPGHFIDYLCHQEPVDAFRLRATRLDIGSIESYHAADRLLKQQPVLL